MNFAAAKALKQKLQANEFTVGSWIAIPHPAIAEVMTRAGFDWLAIDVEHGMATTSQVEELIRTIDLCGSVPLVRLTSIDVNQIKRVMDAGAHGIVVPMVNSEADMDRAIEGLYYPPRGKRGVGLARGQEYGRSFETYKEWANNGGPICVPQIEHISAIEEIDQILSKKEVDACIVGPYDLSASMGIAGEFDNPKLKEVIATIAEAGKRNGKAVGFHVVEPDWELMQERRSQGFNFLAYSVDFRMLDTMCQLGLEKIKQ